MTRQDAIGILNEDLKWAEQNKYPYISGQKQEALKTAIQALEQEPCKDCDYSEIMEWEQDAKTGKAKPIYWCERHKEPCDDAVSRQAILDCKYAISDDEIGERKYVVDVTDIVELPPVTPTRQKGKWVKTPKAVMGEGYMWYCDKCEHQVYQDSSKPYPK